LDTTTLPGIHANIILQEAGYFVNSTISLSLKTSLCLQVKGKAVPLQAWSGPDGSRKLRFPDFMTIAQDGGRLSA